MSIQCTIHTLAKTDATDMLEKAAKTKIDKSVVAFFVVLWIPSVEVEERLDGCSLACVSRI